jgi:hypothetical protein
MQFHSSSRSLLPPLHSRVMKRREEKNCNSMHTARADEIEINPRVNNCAVQRISLNVELKSN